MRNPRTSKLINLTGQSVRLSAADRTFLQDLSRLGIIDSQTSTKEHYSELKGGSDRSLDRLSKAGLLKSHDVYLPNGKFTKAYSFSNKEIAKAWGGQVAMIGARRMEVHELITSRLYYELERPQDFRISSNFNDSDKTMLGRYCMGEDGKATAPDAMYTSNSGELVFVEADSGHYNKAQIKNKQNAWGNFRQVWGQPAKCQCHVKSSNQVAVHKIV